MAIRNFAASTVKGGQVVTSTGGVAASIAATVAGFVDADAKVLLALAQTDIDASVPAETAVAAIKTAYDASKVAAAALATEVNATLYASAQPVTVILNGAVTHNQVKIAFDNILRVLAQSTEYAEN